MAYVYRNVNGKPIQKAMALTQEAQDALADAASKIKARAEAKLARHEDKGHSRIVQFEGNVDHYVSLDDTRGYGAALSIEFGHSGFIMKDGQEVPPMEGLYIITEAASLPRRR